MKPMEQERRKVKPITVREWAWEGRPLSSFERVLEMRERGFRESLGWELREVELRFRMRERARWDLLWELEGSTMEVRWRLGLWKLQRLERELKIGKGLVRFFGEKELAVEVVSMIEGNKLERSAMEFHLRQLKWNPTTVANSPQFQLQTHFESPPQ